jgi:hypothetical protein
MLAPVRRFGQSSGVERGMRAEGVDAPVLVNRYSKITARRPS